MGYNFIFKAIDTMCTVVSNCFENKVITHVLSMHMEQRRRVYITAANVHCNTIESIAFCVLILFLDVMHMKYFHGISNRFS